MSDPTNPPPILGYGTNVHPATSLDELKHNLRTHGTAVREQLRQPTLPIGLWLPEPVALELSENDNAKHFREWLTNHHLEAFTLNGFPQYNFHQPVVKHAVYSPAWWEPARLRHTKTLATLLVRLAPEYIDALSISTLPIGWRAQANDDRIDQAIKHLIQLSEYLEQLESQTNRRITVDLEPEPGCCLDLAQHPVDLFDRLRTNGNPERIHRYLGVTHDTCHAAMMNENQTTVLNKYRDHQIAVNKIQISSALIANQESFAHLQHIHEPRYLHQTLIRSGAQSTFYDDLPEALTHKAPIDEARVHFHVPIFLDHVGQLTTTSHTIPDAITTALSNGTTAFEVETYAWPQLPKDIWTHTLAAGIAEELRWARNHFATITSP
ncbi:metabolite traffic protein EboE [Mucisphaera sp.]|uniref:metabolite traffic protein EboE n=1 Tax=Mucisphaera sp. TaxID=2913024 RepID=UPI003D10F3D4